MSARRGMHLLRWLGPCTDGALVPPAIARRELTVRDGARAFPATVWRPEDEPPTGSLLLVPGLHFLGPRDPRFDRFARVLARSGLLVLAPHLPDFTQLVVGRDLVGDTERAWEALLALPDRPRGKPGVFSISFGSMPALRLASIRTSGQSHRSAARRMSSVSRASPVASSVRSARRAREHRGASRASARSR